jgi:hypothetical protein
MSNDGRLLKIYRDGRRFERITTKRLPPGAKGNLETLAVMKEIILADSQEPDLGNFIFREIIGLDKKTLGEQINAAYTFCRDKIIYNQEKDGFETVADIWSCMYALNPFHPIGDCAIKVVALCTSLSFLNLKPSLVMIGQFEGVDFYNHVFCSAVIDGKETTLDPTPQNFIIGQEAESLRRYVDPIF